jgi:hypothetical protein
VGIQFSGAVLSGEKSVEQRLREVGLRDWPAGSREERYREAGEYDAVLKDHCGCGSEGEGRQAEALVHAGRRIYVAIQ